MPGCSVRGGAKCVRLLAADKVTSGEVKIKGKRAKIRTPLDAMKQNRLPCRRTAKPRESSANFPCVTT